MPALTATDIQNVIKLDDIESFDASYGDQFAKIAVGTTKLGHKFASAALGTNASDSAKTSLYSTFRAASAYAKSRWTAISNVPTGLTADLTANMTWAQCLASAVPDVVLEDISGGVTATNVTGGAYAVYTIAGVSGGNEAYGVAIHPDPGTAADQAKEMATNLAIGFEAYARRVYRLAAWRNLNPDEVAEGMPAGF